ncbi:MAG: ABC transporter permease [Fimbriimonadaceae bacterium]
MTAWLAEQKRVYFGNANSVKEYRIQLRSTKTVWSWGVYLGILVLVALANYGSIGATSSGQTAASVQTALTTYYQLVTGFIHGAILLIAPMISASAIVSEYELRSIELMQCSPVSTKYFFVGKFVASMRQIFLLLFLALPIAAVGVTLGGASWPQILEQFGYIGMQAAIFAAVSMPLAVVTKSILRTVSGVIGIGIGFTIFSSILVGMMFATGGRTFPAVTGLIPFMSALSVGQSTVIGSLSIPNWMVALVVAGLLVKVILLGAGSALTRVGSRETMSLRIHALLLTALFAVLIGIGFSMMPVLGTTGSTRIRTVYMLLCLPMYLGVIQIFAVTGHGRLEERKFFADRFFVLSDSFWGRPSGALGYSLLIVLIISIGVSVPMILQSIVTPLEMLSSTVWNLALGCFTFGLTWLASTFFDQASPARRAGFGFMMAIGAIFHFVGLGVDGAVQSMESLYMFILNPLMPFSNSAYELLGKTVVLMAGGVLFLVIGERRRRKNLQILRNNGYLVDRDEVIAATA